MARHPTPLEHHLRRLRSLVRDHGIAIQYVRDDQGPSWAYSVGLEAWDHPEAIVMGIDPASATHLLDAFHLVVASGEMVPTGRRGELELAGVRCALVGVDPIHLGPSSDLIAGAERYWVRFHRRRITDAVQIVWSDPEGHLPWEASFDPRFERFQPLLDDPEGDPHSWPELVRHR